LIDKQLRYPKGDCIKSVQTFQQEEPTTKLLLPLKENKVEEAYEMMIALDYRELDPKRQSHSEELSHYV